MQEELERKSISVTVQATKLTGRVLRAAIAATLRKIETGQLATPKIVDAICEILGIAVQGDYTKRKDR